MWEEYDNLDCQTSTPREYLIFLAEQRYFTVQDLAIMLAKWTDDKDVDEMLDTNKLSPHFLFPVQE